MRTLITGASSGIGRALSIAMAERGHHVIACARRKPLLEELATEVRASGGHIEILVIDVSDTSNVVNEFRRLDDETPIDIVIANAGVGARESCDPISWEAMADAFHTNFCGAAATLTALLPRMVARRQGHIVGIGSLSSFGALPQSASYCSPKAGLSMLLECLRLDTMQSGIHVTDVHLGFVDTPMVARSEHPMPGLVDAQKAARVVANAIEKQAPMVVYPRALGMATRIAAALPRRMREALVLSLPKTRKK